jgi:hypothetical protein
VALRATLGAADPAPSPPTHDDRAQTIELARELLNVAVRLLCDACARPRDEATARLDDLREIALRAQALAHDGCDSEPE